MKKIAAIDMGTNTFHLLIVKADSPKPVILLKEKADVKIGQGGISNGIINEAAFKRALDTLIDFKKKAEQLEVAPENIFATATSAVRSAQNGPDLVKAIKEKTHIEVKVISGSEEAEYIYHGVKASLEIGPKTSLIIDIGGGSVEFILCNQHKIFWKQSFEMGAQRLLERFMQTDPIEAHAVKRLNNYFEENLIDLSNAIHQYRPEVLIGSSGSFDTLAEIYYKENGMPFDLGSQTEFSLPREAYNSIHEELLTKNHAERMAIPGMIELRADMIVVASCLINYILTGFNIQQIRVSTGALKEGLISKMLA